MSTQTLTDNAATVSKLYEAFGRGDIPYILDHIADDCKWIGSGKDSLSQGGEYKGKEAADFFVKLNEEEEFNSFNPVSVNNIGDNEVAAFGNLTATAKATGKQVNCDWAMHWKFNDEGRVVYFQDFFDTASLYLAKQK